MSELCVFEAFLDLGAVGERKTLVAYVEANFGEDTPPMKGSGDPAEGPFGPR